MRHEIKKVEGPLRSNGKVCDVCGVKTHDPYWRGEERFINESGGFWTKHKTKDLFGHKNCLYEGAFIRK